MKRKAPSSAAKISESSQRVKENAAMERLGPKPFNLHLFTTACMLSAAAWPLASDPEKRDDVVRLVGEMTADMMRGLEAYRASHQRAEKAQHAMIWEEGTTRLLRVSTKGIPVLLVPSLINRYDILDLDAEHSFAAFLSGQGYAPYILDWGAPGSIEQNFTIDDYITKRLYPALKKIDRPHVIGYCMGGTMAAGATAALSDQSGIRSLTLLAAPWDFHAGDPNMPIRMNSYFMSAGPVMTTTGTLPVDWIQALFASIDPLFAFNKFRAFADMDPDGEQARRFVIVEDWLNDGVDLTAPAAQQALSNWYVNNEPHNGVWTIGSNLVLASNIRVPTLVVAAGGDKLVPAPSALAIVQQIAAAQSISPDIGHIGMMASDRAINAVWQPIAAFLQSH
jgi:polyhydroxyalkanoate synthase